MAIFNPLYAGQKPSTRGGGGFYSVLEAAAAGDRAYQNEVATRNKAKADYGRNLEGYLNNRNDIVDSLTDGITSNEAYAQALQDSDPCNQQAQDRASLLDPSGGLLKRMQAACARQSSSGSASSANPSTEFYSSNVTDDVRLGLGINEEIF